MCKCAKWNAGATTSFKINVVCICNSKCMLCALCTQLTLIFPVRGKKKSQIKISLSIDLCNVCMVHTVLLISQAIAMKWNPPQNTITSKFWKQQAIASKCIAHKQEFSIFSASNDHSNTLWLCTVQLYTAHRNPIYSIVSVFQGTIHTNTLKLTHRAFFLLSSFPFLSFLHNTNTIHAMNVIKIIQRKRALIQCTAHIAPWNASVCMIVCMRTKNKFEQRKKEIRTKIGTARNSRCFFASLSVLHSWLRQQSKHSAAVVAAVAIAAAANPLIFVVAVAAAVSGGYCRCSCTCFFVQLHTASKSDTQNNLISWIVLIANVPLKARNRMYIVPNNGRISRTNKRFSPSISLCFMVHHLSIFPTIPTESKRKNGLNVRHLTMHASRYAWCASCSIDMHFNIVKAPFHHYVCVSIAFVWK